MHLIVSFFLTGGNIVFDVQDVLDIPVKEIMANEEGDRSHERDNSLLDGL
jgi:hypothetical protein